MVLDTDTRHAAPGRSPGPASRWALVPHAHAWSRRSTRCCAATSPPRCARSRDVRARRHAGHRDRPAGRGTHRRRRCAPGRRWAPGRTDLWIEDRPARTVAAALDRSRPRHRPLGVRARPRSPAGRTGGSRAASAAVCDAETDADLDRVVAAAAVLRKSLLSVPLGSRPLRQPQRPAGRTVARLGEPGRRAGRGRRRRFRGGGDRRAGRACSPTSGCPCSTLDPRRAARVAGPGGRPGSRAHGRVWCSPLDQADRPRTRSRIAHRGARHRRRTGDRARHRAARSPAARPPARCSTRSA